MRYLREKKGMTMDTNYYSHEFEAYVIKNKETVKSRAEKECDCLIC